MTNTKCRHHCIFFLKEFSHDCLVQPEEPFVTFKNHWGEKKGLSWIRFLKDIRVSFVSVANIRQDFIYELCSHVQLQFPQVSVFLCSPVKRKNIHMIIRNTGAVNCLRDLKHPFFSPFKALNDTCFVEAFGSLRAVLPGWCNTCFSFQQKKQKTSTKLIFESNKIFSFLILVFWGHYSTFHHLPFTKLPYLPWAYNEPGVTSNNFKFLVLFKYVIIYPFYSLQSSSQGLVF